MASPYCGRVSIPETAVSPSGAMVEGRVRRVWCDGVLMVVLVLVMVVVVKAFFVEAFFIPSASMEPTTMVGDRLLVQKVTYWGSGHPERDDIVVFDDPANWLGDVDLSKPGPVRKVLSAVGLQARNAHLIKRVIGVGGDTVRCCSPGGRLTVNGKPVKEPFIKDQTSTAEVPFTVKVPEGFVWVMGDNRGNSEDSRFHRDDKNRGFVPVEKITGKAWVRVWPLQQFGGL